MFAMVMETKDWASTGVVGQSVTLLACLRCAVSLFVYLTWNQEFRRNFLALFGKIQVAPMVSAEAIVVRHVTTTNNQKPDQQQTTTRL